jgi:hypothetical protein
LRHSEFQNGENFVPGPNSFACAWHISALRDPEICGRVRHRARGEFGDAASANAGWWSNEAIPTFDIATKEHAECA